MNQPTQFVNNWYIPQDQISTLCGPDIDIPQELTRPLPWSRYKDKSLVGETEQEKQERIEAVKEQLKLGIIKESDLKKKPQIVNPQTQNPQLQKFIQTLKQDPNTAIDSDKFRPKVKDNSTGQVRKLGPNDKCPCGSGKKYKKCHGRCKF